MSDDIDHIIWACGDLADGTRRFEALTGVRPRYGGLHANGRTHNALVDLDGRRYLEILAPVGPAAAGDDAWTALAHTAGEPRILTYCLRSSRPLSELASMAASRGWGNAVVAGNGRTTPEGIHLRWQWLAPRVERFGLAFPFFIDWLDSPHPSESLRAAQPPSGIRLGRFSVGHPDHTDLQRTLAELGSSIDTVAAPDTRFVVELQTPLGTVSL